MLSRVTGETIRERSKRSAEQSKCRNYQNVRSDCPTVSKSDQVQGTLRIGNLADVLMDQNACISKYIPKQIPFEILKTRRSESHKE